MIRRVIGENAVHVTMLHSSCGVHHVTFSVVHLVSKNELNQSPVAIHYFTIDGRRNLPVN